MWLNVKRQNFNNNSSITNWIILHNSGFHLRNVHVTFYIRTYAYTLSFVLQKSYQMNCTDYQSEHPHTHEFYSQLRQSLHCWFRSRTLELQFNLEFHDLHIRTSVRRYIRHAFWGRPVVNQNVDEFVYSGCTETSREWRKAEEKYRPGGSEEKK